MVHPQGVPVTSGRKDELLATAVAMSARGLCPGTSGNASLRLPRGCLVTPSGLAYDQMRLGDLVELDASGRASGSRTPTSEWRLHLGIYARRPDVHAIVHTHSMFATTWSIARRPIPAVHYMIVLAGVTEIPCAPYAGFGTEELAAVAATALGAGKACLLANHGLVAVGATGAEALKVATEIEIVAEQAWRATLLGGPVVLSAEECEDARARFGSYGQPGRPRLVGR